MVESVTNIEIFRPAIKRAADKIVVGIVQAVGKEVLHIRFGEPIGGGEFKQAWKSLRVEDHQVSLGLWVTCRAKQDDAEKELGIWKECQGDHILPPPEGILREGQELHLLSRHLKKGSLDTFDEPATTKTIVSICGQMALGVQELHQCNFAHMDIHLGNFVYSIDGTGKVAVWLIDFETCEELNAANHKKDIEWLQSAMDEFLTRHRTKDKPIDPLAKMAFQNFNSADALFKYLAQLQ